MNKRKKVEHRIVRTNPIEQHYTDCLSCGHVHNVELLMKYYKRQGAHSMHYLCDKCNHRMRLTITKFDYLVFHKQAVNGYEKRQWDDIFQVAEIEIPQEVKTWLIRSYQPPRKRSVNELSTKKL
jgi:transcription elongation factor Elf1